MNNADKTPAGFVMVTIRFTSGTLEGVEIPQAVPSSIAKIGHVVKSSGNGPGYVVVALG